MILTFDAPTNEGGTLCLGYCPCAVLLDEATVQKLQVLPRPALPRPACSLAPRACHTAAPTLSLACGGIRAMKNPNPSPSPNPNPNQGNEEFEPYCEWLGPDALRADVLSSSTLTKLVDELGIKPQAIHSQD